LIKNFNYSKDNKIKQIFLIFYQGLKPDRFYWEFANTVRKILILAALLFQDTLKVVLSSIVLIVTARIQLYLEPYTNSRNNEVELLAILSGVVTILSTLIYTEEEKVDSIHRLVLALTIYLNLIFFTKWLYLL